MENFDIVRNSYHPKCETRGPGRPRNGRVDNLKSQYWFWEVACELGVISDYAVELYYIQSIKGDQFKKEDFVYTGRFRNHKNGVHLPNQEIVNWFGVRFPCTKSGFTHPFWEVAKHPVSDIHELYDYLTGLQPDVIGELFYPVQKKGHPPPRHSMLRYDSIKGLNRVSDLDALTACLGLIHEAEYYAYDDYLNLYASTAVNILTRILTLYPFSKISLGLFEYLKDRYFVPYLNKENHFLLEKESLEIRIDCNNFRKRLIKRQHLLRHHVEVPPACLYLAERYISPKIILELNTYYNGGNLKAANNHLAVRKLKRCLRKWESSIIAKNTH